MTAPFTLSEFARYRQYSVAGNSYVTESLTNFPLYISFAADAAMDICRSDGYDVAFADEDGNIIPGERAYWSGGNGSSVTAGFWVKVPTIYSDKTTSLFCYYSRSGDDDCSWDPTSVWDANFKGVWHLQENGGPYLDSTVAGNHGTVVTAPTRVAGIIGYAQSFPGASTNQHILTATTGLPTGSAARSLEIWFARAGSGTRGTCGWGGSGSNTMFGCFITGTTILPDYGSGYRQFSWTANTNWHYFAQALAAGAKTSNLAAYLDGDPKTTTYNDFVLNTATTSNTIGGKPAYNYPWIGHLQEYRISNAVRPASYFHLTYHNIADVGNCLTLDWDDAVYTGPTGPFPWHTSRLMNGGCQL